MPVTHEATDLVEEIRLPDGGSLVITDEKGVEIFRVLDGADGVRVRGVALSAPTPASQAEMEAGAEAAIRSMSPLRVAQAVAALGGSGGFVVSDRVTLSAAQILASFDTPVEIVPSPGTGQIIWPVSWFTHYHFGTVPYPDHRIQSYWNGVSLGGAHIFGCKMSGSGDKVTADGASVADSLTSDADDCPIMVKAEGAMNAGPVVTTTLAAGGSGYAPGDTGTINGDNSDAAYEVDTVDGGGAVLTYHITAAGTDSHQVENGVGTFATSGGGSGFTVNITEVVVGDGTLDITVLYRVVDLA